MALSNGLKRVLTALVAVPLVIGLMYLGGWPFVALVLGIALLAQYELYGMAQAAGMRPLVWPGLALGAVVVAHTVLPYWVAWTLLGIVGLICATPFLKGDNPLHRVAVTLFGVVYPAGLLGLLIDIRMAAGFDARTAFWLTLVFFLLIWAADVGAYYAGRSLGRRPLFPSVSPKKTWEGFIGGVVLTLLVAVAVKLWLLPQLGWPDVAVFAFIGGVVGPLGDLAESRLKRAVGVKDSGTLLPGHGGMLDRFDAMVVTVPLFYLYLTYVMGAGTP